MGGLQHRPSEDQHWRGGAPGALTLDQLEPFFEILIHGQIVHSLNSLLLPDRIHACMNA